MAPVALSFGVLAATGHVSDVGLVLAASSLPMVCLLLLGGVVADAVPRRLLLVISHALAGLAQLATALWFLTGLDSVPLLAAFGALGGAAYAFTGPALRGLIVDLMPAESLGRGNAARTASRNVTRMLGPGLGGVLVGITGAGWVLAIDAACLLAAAAILATLPGAPRTGPDAHRTGGPRRVVQDLRDGWHEFASRRWLWTASSGFLVLNVLIGAIWLVLGPVLAAHSFGAAGWGVVLGARATGQVVGGLLAYRWRIERPLLGVLLAPLPYAAVFVAIGAGAGLPILLACAGVAGVGSALSDVQWETTIQRQVPSAAISRVSSWDMMLSFLSVPVGQMAAPALAATVGAPAVAMAGGAVCALALTLPLLSREVRGLRTSHGSSAVSTP